MQKHVLTFGAISGAIIATLMLLNIHFWMTEDGKMNFDNSETFGYVSMIVALSMIFFGVRSYRDKHLMGSITFGKALKVGVLITLVASAIYVAAWMIYYHATDLGQSFLQQYLDHMVEKMRQSGKPQAEIDQAVADLTKNMELYKNPLVMIGMTFLEIFPVGLVISLISAFLLKKRQA